MVWCDECERYGHHSDYCNAVWCDDCGRCIQSGANNWQSNKNNLAQHAKTHRPRNLACPVCGEQRFHSATGVALHFEGGNCTKCRNPGQAAGLTYQFVRNQAPNFLNHAICDRDFTHEVNPNYVPNNAYNCPTCGKNFSKFASLSQHMEDAHRQNAPRFQALGW
ncbi:unnamed protein product [Amoebophrya sp. A120]|nr:unnamed protein product [Amoebophrya sp. A120]|eukprot:GSA120T00018961001.1